MGRLSKYIRPYVGYIILSMVIKLVGAVMELFVPYLMEIILDDVVPSGGRRWVFIYGALMLLCAGGCLLANIIANRMSAISSGKITLAIRHDLFERLSSLSARQMDQLTVSSAESRLTSDTYNINQLLARIQRLGVRAPILLLGGIVMMLGMDAPLSLVLIIMLPAIALIVYFVTRASVPLYTKEQGVLDKVVRVLQENITGIRVIKALSKTEYEKGRFNQVNQELTNVDQKAGIISGITNPSASLILNLGLTVVVVAGAYRVNAGSCQSGVIVAFLQYFVMILNAMLGVTRIFVIWSKGEASAQRVADVLATPADLTVLSAPAEKAGEESHGAVPHVEFRGVSFSYTGIGQNISHLSICLMRGESLGILGATGSGKSTILNLLMRFYDPDQGHTAGGAAAQVRRGVPERFCGRGHHCRQYPLFPASGGRFPPAWGGGRPGRGVHCRQVRGHERAGGGPGQQPFRRPEAAAADRPGPGWFSGNPGAGRRLFRPGLPHRRPAAPGPAQRIPECDHHPGGPAGQLHPPLRSYPGPLRRPGHRQRHP